MKLIFWIHFNLFSNLSFGQKKPWSLQWMIYTRNWTGVVPFSSTGPQWLFRPSDMVSFWNTLKGQDWEAQFFVVSSRTDSKWCWMTLFSALVFGFFPYPILFNICMKLLWGIIRGFGMGCYQYAGNIQCYLSFPSLNGKAGEVLNAWLMAVMDWMRAIESSQVRNTVSQKTGWSSTKNVHLFWMGLHSLWRNRFTSWGGSWTQLCSQVTAVLLSILSAAPAAPSPGLIRPGDGYSCVSDV